MMVIRYTINGRVKIPSLGAKGLLLPGKLSNVKVILNGGQRITFLKPDGYFSFHNVPAGTHLIEVAALGYFFSPVRVDVSARNPGKVQAALTENRRGLTELVLEPLREEQYYEIREPFNIMSLLKSPMGLMVGFMVIVMFLMPKLVENMVLKYHSLRPIFDFSNRVREIEPQRERERSWFNSYFIMFKDGKTTREKMETCGDGDEDLLRFGVTYICIT